MIQAVRRSVLPLVSFITTAPETTFDENGEALVSVAGDEDVATIYISVGDGSEPADPTAGANDGSVSARQGTIASGVKVTTGNDAWVKVRGADAAGNLGPVVLARQGRRLGQFHKDLSNRSTSSTSQVALETVSIPANVLGLDGALRATFGFDLTGGTDAKTIRVRFGGSDVLVYTAPAAYFGFGWIEVIVANDGDAALQRVSSIAYDERPNIDIARTSLAKDTTGAVDLEFTGQLANGADSIILQVSMVELLGTS